MANKKEEAEKEYAKTAGEAGIKSVILKGDKKPTPIEEDAKVVWSEEHGEYLIYGSLGARTGERYSFESKQIGAKSRRKIEREREAETDQTAADKAESDLKEARAKAKASAARLSK